MGRSQFSIFIAVGKGISRPLGSILKVSQRYASNLLVSLMVVTGRSMLASSSHEATTSAFVNQCYELVKVCFKFAVLAPESSDRARTA
jgi:hypothetical protein